jgi:hypothetical protein
MFRHASSLSLQRMIGHGPAESSTSSAQTTA